MRTPRLLLFDVDGTLIKAYNAGRRALEEAFLEVFGRDDVAAALDPVWFAGRTDLFIFRQVALGAGIQPWDYERRYSALEDCYLRRLRAAVEGHPQKQVMPGVIALLETLTARRGPGGPGADAHIRASTANATVGPAAGPAPAPGGSPAAPALGLMTGNLEAGARIKLSPWDLNRFFPTGGFGSDALERHEIGQVARDRFERLLGAPIEREEIWVVGDTVADIEAARRCGFRVLAVGTGWTGAEVLQAAEPDAYLPDLSDTQESLRTLGC
jgi:phosphoglycolate phosphatase-like HAD superfamily hydrolase